MLKTEKVQEVKEKVLTDNVVALYGIGSFFYGDMTREYSAADRTIDLIVFVKDLDRIHTEQKARDLNEESPMYLHFDCYRLTVVPMHHLAEWTSPGSSIGYFLRGRFQKPLEELLPAKEVEERLLACRREGVDHTFRRLYGEFSRTEFMQEIARTSYLPEGFRGWIESGLKGKHKAIFAAQPERFRAIYNPLIDDYLLEHKVIEWPGKIRINNTKSQAKEFEDKLKNLLPGYAKVLINLAEVHEDPEDFAVRKGLRSLKFSEENKVMYWIGSKTVRYYMGKLEHYAKQQVSGL